MRRASIFAVLLLPIPLCAQSADEKQATIAFLKSLRQPDGGFIAAPMDPKSDAAPKSSLRATSAAVRAIKYFGGDVPNAEKTIGFVQSCFHKKAGGFSDQPNGSPDVTSTAIGLMAAAELYREKFAEGHNEIMACGYLLSEAKTFEERRLAVAGMEPWKFRSPTINDWFVEIEKPRNADGTYGQGDGQARDTGGVAAMILRSGGKLSDEHRKAVIAALQAGQRSDGGFGKANSKASDGETTYRVMRAFYLLGEKPKDVEKLKAFMASCRNKDGGYGVAPGQPSAVGGTYYVAAIGKWLAK